MFAHWIGAKQAPFAINLELQHKPKHHKGRTKREGANDRPDRWSALQLTRQGTDGATLAMRRKYSHVTPRLEIERYISLCRPEGRHKRLSRDKTDLPPTPSQEHARCGDWPAGTQYYFRLLANFQAHLGGWHLFDTQYSSDLPAYGNSIQKPYVHMSISTHLKKCFQEANRT
jgi:hypothetical protein